MFGLERIWQLVTATAHRPAPLASARMIEYGDADVMVCRVRVHRDARQPLAASSHKALSTRNDDPATASRPWTRDRDGFVLGEGAGVAIEEYEHAVKRSAHIYAELALVSAPSGDLSHDRAPDTGGPAAAWSPPAECGCQSERGAVRQYRHLHAAG